MQVEYSRTFKIFAVDPRPVTKLSALVAGYGGFCCQNRAFRMSITKWSSQ